MRQRRTSGPRFPENSDAECADCPVAPRCWDALLAPGSGLHARRQPRLEHGEVLIEQGKQSSDVYVVVSGCLVLRETMTDSASCIVGFRLPGEIVGLESWVLGTHSYTALAAGTTFVCRLTLPPAGSGLASTPALEQLLIKCALLLYRGSRPWAGLPAGERVAAFLQNFIQRAQIKGSTHNAFRLPMTRAEIGSYLGLAEETVVRALGRMRVGRLLRVQGKTVIYPTTDMTAVGSSG